MARVERVIERQCGEFAGSQVIWQKRTRAPAYKQRCAGEQLGTPRRDTGGVVMTFYAKINQRKPFLREISELCNVEKIEDFNLRLLYIYGLEASNKACKAA